MRTFLDFNLCWNMFESIHFFVVKCDKSSEIILANHTLSWVIRGYFVALIIFNLLSLWKAVPIMEHFIHYEIEEKFTVHRHLF